MRFRFGLSFALTLAPLGHSLWATDDGRRIGFDIDIEQTLNYQQIDSSDPVHDRSTFSIGVEMFDDPSFSPSVSTVPEVQLPPGATASIAQSDFTAAELTASFERETTEEGLQAFPAGAYTFTFRSPDGECVSEASKTRSLFVGPGTAKPAILSPSNWFNGVLHLPSTAPVARWESAGRGLWIAGDTEQTTTVSVYASPQDPALFSNYVEAETGGGYYPLLVIGDDQGIDLGAVPGVVEGQIYTIVVEKEAATVSISGVNLINERTISRVRFEAMIDPAITVPPKPQISLETTNQLTLWWPPDAAADYLVLGPLDNLDAHHLRSIPRTPLLHVTPHVPPTTFSHSSPMSATSRFFRIVTVPR